MELDGKVCVITGGASGIGAACGRAFAELGTEELDGVFLEALERRRGDTRIDRAAAQDDDLIRTLRGLHADEFRTLGFEVALQGGDPIVAGLERRVLRR